MYSQAFENAVDHCMLYEVGSHWDVNADGVIDGTNDINCGYTNDPDDSGGETKFGLSKNNNPTLDITNLTWPQAQAAYYSLYWLAGACDKLNGRIAALQFDGNVNNGVRRSTVFLQISAGITADGYLGNGTLAKVAETNVISLCILICNQRTAFYNAIVKSNPSQSIYLNGWLRRISEMQAFVTDLSIDFDSTNII